MGHKHLHELLKEDQEPFHLNTYISNHLIHVKSNTTLNTRKRKPIIQSTSTSTTARNFCINHVCFFKLHESPDVRKSPFLDIKSPFHVPSRTASMLLDAALRVHKPKKPKPGLSGKAGFGLFGSLLKRLKDRRSRIKRREISLSSYDSPLAHDLKEVYENENDGFVLSPFRFSLVNSSPSTGGRTPDFISPTTSPTHPIIQLLKWTVSRPTSAELSQFEDLDVEIEYLGVFSDVHAKKVKKTMTPMTGLETKNPMREKKDYEGVESRQIHLEEEDKEQCSPVSVLDPLFYDDEEEHDVGAVVEDGYDLECCYTNVQRAKQQLLQKLQRFEKLANLDPIELDKHMSEQCSDDIDENSTTEDVLRGIIKDFDAEEVPTHMKKLVLDLIHEEGKNELEEDVVIGRVIGRWLSYYTKLEVKLSCCGAEVEVMNAVLGSPYYIRP
ncbi:hypothetical protein CTI12_AA053150 [Artemisia annua]|uniref:Uncharacterized protein n=1 Tax=Artemisia annua TaxID=35608 RepID=A0A2U1QB18_ARTAN|nr:hypothetical protein CTI12_AA053150 [Artemisia annua]